MRELESIWIALEVKGFITAEEALDQNTDVIVTFATGERYGATFFTYQNITTLTNKNQVTGECLNGRYFWASDMVLADRIDRASIEQLIDHLLTSGGFWSVFKPIP